MKKRLSQEDVFQTATQLSQEGIEPSVKLIRERIGSGSFATISKYFKLWQAEKPTEETIFSLEEVLADVEVDVLSEYLHNEHPQIIALIFSHLPAKQVADVIKGWGPVDLDEILSRMENLGYVQDKVVNRIAQVLAKELRSLKRVHLDQKGGTEFVNEIRKEMGGLI